MQIRPVAGADGEALLAIARAVDSGGPPPSATSSRGGAGERLVAEVEGWVSGYGSILPAWWTGRDDAFHLELMVDPARWGAGIGSQLYARLEEEARSMGGARLSAWVREDAARGRAFAAARGWKETGELDGDYSLDLGEARIEAQEKAGDRLRGEGIRMETLAALDPDAATLGELHRLWSGGEPRLAFDAWRSAVLEGPGLSPDTHWLALDGDTPVGMTFLNRLTAEAAENDFTTVLPAYRGRGIAGALKAKAVRWGRENGLRTFHTQSDIGNWSMIAVNRALGYLPGPRRMEIAKDLGE